jgi:hypothetical protein
VFELQRALWYHAKHPACMLEHDNMMLPHSHALETARSNQVVSRVMHVGALGMGAGKGMRAGRGKSGPGWAGAAEVRARERRREPRWPLSLRCLRRAVANRQRTATGSHLAPVIPDPEENIAAPPASSGAESSLGFMFGGPGWSS